MASSLLKRFSSFSSAAAAPTSSVPDLMTVLSKKQVSHDDYASLHQVAVRLEERCVAAERATGEPAAVVLESDREVRELREKLQVKDRMMKIAVAAVVLALFLPGLLSLLFTLLMLAAIAFYFLDVHPVRGQIDNLFTELARLFETAASRKSIAAATSKAQRHIK